MATKTINAFTAITSIDNADEVLVWDASAGATRKITFANFQSGYLTTTTGLQASGATTGATSQAQTFTNGIVGPTWKPASNSTTALQLQNAAGTTNIVTVDTTNGRVGINLGATPAAYGIDVIDGSGAIRINQNLVNMTGKFGRFVVSHYDNSEENILAFHAAGNNGSNVIIFGGGSSIFNSATRVEFRTAASHTTLAGTIRMSIDASGNVAIGAHTQTALLDVDASSTARSSLRIRDGIAPTTPGAGDIWNDGALSFYNADATTAAVVNHLRLRRSSTGAAAAGFGLGIIAELESSTTDAQSAGRLTWEWATATHASRAAKGKLTAFYTTTEHAAITWVADSAGINVGIGELSPTLKLHISESNVNATGVRITNTESSGELTLYSAGNTAFGIASWVDAAVMESSSGHANGMVLSAYDGTLAFQTNARTTRMTLTKTSGYLGLGTTSPQGLLHGHDGSGGFLFVNRASVGGTLVTVIPNGTGDVAEKLVMHGWVTNSAPFSADVALTTLAVSSSTTKSDGVNTLTLAVAADGSFTLQATAGAATWNVCLWVYWR